MESPEEKNLPFWIVLVHNLPSVTHETSVYRKATDIVLPYDSNSPANYKRNCAKALLNKVTTHCKLQLPAQFLEARPTLPKQSTARLSHQQGQPFLMPKTYCPTPSSLEFRHSSQIGQTTSRCASKCEGPSEGTYTAQSEASHPMLCLSQCLRLCPVEHSNTL